ncbi:MAG TPA: IPT/TIG domain-containing protein [Armatimonadota bacterium]|nr:IPT/TIG domain-containing protein [Armatimonadota bacterium]
MATISSVFPLAGVAGAVVTVRGGGFIAQTQARIGGVSAAVSVVSATELAVTVPAGVAAGPADLAVSDDGLAWATLAKGVYVLAAPATTTPGNLLQGSARAVFIDGRPVGFTDAPVKLAHDVALSEAEVEQEVGAVKLFKQQERWRMSLSLAEVSLENLCTVFDGAEVVEAGAVRTLALGGTAAVREHSLLVLGPGPNGGQRDFFVYRAVIDGREPLTIARETPQRLPLSFRLLPEMSLPAGQRVLRIAEGGAA